MRALLWGLALALAVAAPAQAGPLGAAIGSISAASCVSAERVRW